MGQEWVYPSGTDVALRTLCRLENLGYRGKELRFALWWINHNEFSGEVREYVCSNFTAALKLIEDVTGRKMKAAYPEGDPAPDAESSEDKEINRKDILTFEFREAVLRGLVTLIQRYFQRETSNVNLKLWIGLFAGALFGVDPAVFEIYPEDLEGQPEEILSKYLSNRKLIETISSAPESHFERARSEIRMSKELMEFLRKLRKVGQMIVNLASKRYQERLGPLRKTPVATRAIVVGILVFWYSVVDIPLGTGYNRENQE